MSAAGRSLNIDPSTMSRRLAAAEAALNTRLFIRDNAGYHPTEAGLVFLGYAERVYGDVKSMLLDTCSEAEGVCGAVRITSIDFLFSHWLVEHMPALIEQHPNLQLQLLVGNQALSFTRREADFALRLARPQDDAALLMRKLGEIGFAVYGAERFADIPRQHWGEQPWLAYGEDLAEMAEMRWLRAQAPEAFYPVRVSSVSTLVHACQTGLGLALLPCLIGERNGLRRLSVEVEVLREVWLLSHRDAGKIGRYQAVGNWLKQVFADDSARLRGELPLAPPL
ncbi:LysR family transcriptional regulator [Pseudomonas alcaligenes]|uniref:LysR family transcriptional regulator n=2 Tax=Aquipseudomonas alcaligenes TaxID=43263 RepID=A0ABR7S482_AQUAC|nr:LysR family transcriptional regulator [Pseudomonas alcaligenes]